MKKTFFYIFIFSAIFPIFANEAYNRFVKTGLPIFQYQVFEKFIDTLNSYQIECNIQITNNRINFEKKDSIYQGRYEVIYALFDNDNDDIPLKQFKQKRKVFAQNYFDTGSEKLFQVSGYNFVLKYGKEYFVTITVVDLISKTRYTTKEINFYMEEKESVGVTKMIMERIFDNGDNVSSYSPIIGNSIEKSNKNIGVFFQVYSEMIDTPYSINYKVFALDGSDKVKAKLYENKYDRVSKKHINNELIKFNITEFKIGKYKIEANIDIDGMVFEREIIFFIRWKKINVDIADINDALKQLVFIAEKSEIDSILKGNETIKKQWFDNFWEVVSKNTEIKKSIVMEEYFRRITYCKVHFSVPKRSGWKTDRGQVYCTMGEPDEISYYAFPKSGHPYQVWVYYTKGLRYVFDQIGGDYVLRSF